MPKARPRTGERRKTHQPLKVDLLPQDARDAIQFLRNYQFRTWETISERSALPYSKDWPKDGGGFIDWEKLTPAVRTEFPSKKLPTSTLHRWYDLRVEQVQGQIIKESETARAFAQKFVGKDIDDPSGAVLNAMRDEVFALAGKMDTESRGLYMKSLNQLTLAMSRIERTQMQKLKVEADIAKSETERARIAAQSGEPREIYLRAVSDLLKKLRTRDTLRKALDPIRDEIVQEMSYAAEVFAKQVQAAAA